MAQINSTHLSHPEGHIFSGPDAADLTGSESTPSEPDTEALYLVPLTVLFSRAIEFNVLKTSLAKAERSPPWTDITWTPFF